MAGKMFLTMTDTEQKKVGDALEKSLPKTVNAEVKKMMIHSTHGVRVREAQRERLKGQVPKVEDMFNAPAKRLAYLQGRPCVAVGDLVEVSYDYQPGQRFDGGRGM